MTIDSIESLEITDDSRVFLWNRAGVCIEYASPLALYQALGREWLIHNVGAYFDKECRTGYGSTIFKNWVLRDCAGSVVLLEDIFSAPAVVIATTTYNSWLYRERLYGSYVGYGPVPGVSCHWGGRSHRRFKHINERRMSLWFAQEGEVPPRAKRSHCNIPNPWDDYPVTSRDDRSWKRFRATQWKD